MQSAVPDVMDLSKEAEATLELYGIGSGQPSDTFGRQCLLARRFAEAGVRFIEVGHGRAGTSTTTSSTGCTRNCRATDKPIAGLLTDLKQRGLLDDTLVVWGGEFGRTPTNQGRDGRDGRDHNNRGYTMWLAGGGVKGGIAPRRHRRLRRRGRRRQGPRPRPARHDPAPARPRPREAHLPLRRPRLPPDGRVRQRRERRRRLTGRGGT